MQSTLKQNTSPTLVHKTDRCSCICYHRRPFSHLW